MANESASPSVQWTGTVTVALILIVVAILGLGIVTTQEKGDEQTTSAPWTWYAILVLLTLFIMVAGYGVTGRFWGGFLIDSRNKMTLSRLQLILWTILVLSAYLTVVLARIRTVGAGAFAVAIPTELWWLMGISTTSLVGSPLILSNKRQQQPDPDQIEHTVQQQAALQGEDPADVKSRQGYKGTVVYNKRPAHARFSDLFRGDETGNAAHLDLGKVQLFLFTVVLVAAYAFLLAGKFSDLLGEGASFPALDEGIVALLGISHGGYLAGKAVPSSQKVGGASGPPADPPPTV